jgi:CO/xanthine dehydrogenase Mo-binding subunit
VWRRSVKINTQMAGGGFGRRAIATSDYVVEACNVAKAARGAGLNGPVRTLWSREDDIKGGYYRPMHVHRAEIGFDAQGKILAWDHVIVGQSILKGTPFEDFMVKDGVDGTMVEGMKEPYEMPMRLSVHHPKVNVPVLWWRSVGSTHTAYVMETLIDEIARAPPSRTRWPTPEADGRQAPAPCGRAAAGGRQVRLRQAQAGRRPRLGRGGARVFQHRGGLCGRSLGQGQGHAQAAW